ncbi:YncE family protein [Actinokineospora soli]|uniref:YncE family protein n=1 Tax=Actinokineospora soli TaxID=1048753 RepID=A0ABW2TQ14_9PSEU
MLHRAAAGRADGHRQPRGRDGRRVPGARGRARGRTWPSTPVTSLAASGSYLAVGTETGVDLYSTAALGPPAHTIALPGPVESLSFEGTDLYAAVPSRNVLARVDPISGKTDQLPVDGAPAATSSGDGGKPIVALQQRKAVGVLTDGKVTRQLEGGLLSADRLFTSGDRTVVLDRLRNALFRVDFADGDIEEGLRAGDGATNGVTDRFGRVLVVDTRGNALLAFGLDPLLLRQRYPVPGSPYGIAYDDDRDLAWVTLTATNEVVGFDVAGGEPVERYRFPTVGQPNSVAVNPADGSVVVASANGGGVQVIKP